MSNAFGRARKLVKLSRRRLPMQPLLIQHVRPNCSVQGLQNPTNSGKCRLQSTRWYFYEDRGGAAHWTPHIRWRISEYFMLEFPQLSLNGTFLPAILTARKRHHQSPFIQSHQSKKLHPTHQASNPEAPTPIKPLSPWFPKAPPNPSPQKTSHWQADQLMGQGCDFMMKRN